MRWRNSSSATRADDESETWRYGIVSKVQSHGEIAFSERLRLRLRRFSVAVRVDRVQQPYGAGRNQKKI